VEISYDTYLRYINTPYMKRLLLFLVIVPVCAWGQIITTVAGNGTTSFSNGEYANNTGINLCLKVAFDRFGNTYVPSYSRIYKINPQGIITSVVGTGVLGFSGDSNLAILAKIHGPTGVAVDSSGNLYIADAANNRIRRVDNSTGIITTIAGTGSVGYSGDNGLAISAQLSSPLFLTFDKFWNLIFSDNNNHCIRKINITTGNITTIAGNGTPGFSGDNGLATQAQLVHPGGICFDTLGNLYIADFDNNRVRKVSLSGIITTVAGCGIGGVFSGDSSLATLAGFYELYDITVDVLGNIYIADGHNNRVRKIDITNGIIYTIVGTGIGTFGGDNGAASLARIYQPEAVNIDYCGNLYISDVGNYRIRKVWFNTDTIPQVNIAVTPNDTVVTGTAVTTTATATNHGTVTSYQWVKNGANAGTNSAYTYTPVNGDSVYCIVTVRACTGRMYTDTTTAIHITVTGGAGVTNTTTNTTHTYPNPVTDVLHVATTEAQHYVLYNVMGVAIVHGSVDKQNSIDMKAIPSGIYLLQLTNAQGQREVVKVVKE
jgi:sugar lactone lactonase YvrE